MARLHVNVSDSGGWGSGLIPNIPMQSLLVQGALIRCRWSYIRAFKYGVVSIPGYRCANSSTVFEFQ